MHTSLCKAVSQHRVLAPGTKGLLALEVGSAVRPQLSSWATCGLLRPRQLPFFWQASLPDSFSASRLELHGVILASINTAQDACYQTPLSWSTHTGWLFGCINNSSIEQKKIDRRFALTAHLKIMLLGTLTNYLVIACVLGSLKDHWLFCKMID